MTAPIKNEEVTQIVVPQVAAQVIQVTEDPQQVYVNINVSAIKVQSITQHIYINPA